MEVNRSRILEGRPLLFENYLLALNPLDSTLQHKKISFNSEAFWVQMHNLPCICMNQFYGSQVGSVIGNVLDVELEGDDMGWGTFVR